MFFETPGLTTLGPPTELEQIDELRASFDNARTQMARMNDGLSDLTLRADALENLPDRIQPLLAILQNLEPGEAESILKAGSEIAETRTSLARLENDFASFSEALLLSDPAEILTVARLGDRFDFISDQVARLEQDLAANEERAEALIQRGLANMDAQVDRIVGLAGWLVVLLAPFLLKNAAREFAWSKPAEPITATKSE